MLNAEELNVTQNQFDALISFAFNLGLSALAGSTLWRLFTHGDIQGAANEFTKWIYAGGAHHAVVSTALTKEDIALFAKLTNTEVIFIG